MSIPVQRVREELVRNQRRDGRLLVGLITLGITGSVALVGFLCWAIVRFTLHYT